MGNAGRIGVCTLRMLGVRSFNSSLSNCIPFGGFTSFCSSTDENCPKVCKLHYKLLTIFALLITNPSVANKSCTNLRVQPEPPFHPRSTVCGGGVLPSQFTPPQNYHQPICTFSFPPSAIDWKLSSIGRWQVEGRGTCAVSGPASRQQISPSVRDSSNRQGGRTFTILIVQACSIFCLRTWSDFYSKLWEKYVFYSYQTEQNNRERERKRERGRCCDVENKNCEYVKSFFLAVKTLTHPTWRWNCGRETELIAGRERERE